jgi:curved DNA-binding protein CbpA
MDGEGVCKKIRESAKGKEVPIIMMSGPVNDPSDIERLKTDLTLSGFLIKPFSSGMLYSLISSSLQDRAAEPAVAAPQPSINKQPPSIKGDLEKTPFEKVLLYLMMKRGTGILTVTKEFVKRSFSFIDGAPVELEPSSEDDDFGNYLAHKNLIDEVELREYEERWTQEGEDPRDIFIKMGCLTPQRFQEESRNFLNDSLIECFSWGNGSFLFEWIPSLIKTFPAARAFMPYIFYKGFKACLSPARISSFIEEKGNLYVNKTAEFYEHQNHLAAELTGAELLDRLDGLKTCSEIVNSIDIDDAAVILYTLDYLRVLSYGTTPKKSDVAPPFPIRERGKKLPNTEVETFEDLGGELSELADELGGLGAMKGSRATAAETEGLTALEEDLKKQWETIKNKNYYEIFGMTAKTFSFEKLKKSYFEFTKTYGPEKFFASSSEVMSLAEEFLSKISNAYNTLSIVVSKENYDELLSSQEQVPTGEEDKEFYEQIQFQSGKVFLEQGQYESAEKAFANCINIDSKKPEYHAYLALTVYNNPANKGNPTSVKRAKDMVNKSLQLGRLSIAYALKGTMLLDEGSLNFAEAELNKALKLNPNNKAALKKMEVIREKREEEKKGFFQRMFK